MSAADLLALGPWILIALGSLVVLLGISIWRQHGYAFFSTLLSLAVAGLLIPGAASVAPRRVTPLLQIDGLALVLTGALLAATALVTLLAKGYLDRRKEQREELYVLLLLSTLGGMVLAAARHFAALFLGLELLSVGLYALLGYLRDERPGVEAALKYLVLAAASSAFLLFGGALIYAETGTLVLSTWASAASTGGILFVSGISMVLVGFGFKLALVPFHLWTPDVYQGSPAPATAFLATVSKASVFGVLLRTVSEGSAFQAAFPLLAVVAGASMLVGNFLALVETRVKRLLAYSSIAHMGYLLVGFLALRGALAAPAVLFYLAAYMAALLAAFGVLTVLSSEAGEPDVLDDLQGLFWCRPALAAVLTAALLSLAGLPLTAGFLAKIYVLAAGVETSLWFLVLLLVATSVVGLFYYLRVVVALFRQAPDEDARTYDLPATPGWGAFALGVLLVLLLGLGVWPEPFLRLLGWAVVGVF